MVKKFFALIVALLFISAVAYAEVEDIQKTENGPVQRVGLVMKRGFINAVSMPAEFVTTFQREADTHNRLWPVTGIPRAVYNFICRATSATNDLLFYPWVSLFSEETRPWTEPMGLPEYPWQVEALEG